METGEMKVEYDGMFKKIGITYYRVRLVIHDYCNIVRFPIDLTIKKEKQGYSIGVLEDYFVQEPRIVREKAKRKFSLSQVEELLQKKYGDDYIKDIMIQHIDENYQFPYTDDISEFVNNQDIFEFFVGEKFLLNYRPSTYPQYYAETKLLLRKEKINKIRNRLTP